jgi:aminopeptidase YwaD
MHRAAPLLLLFYATLGSNAAHAQAPFLSGAQWSELREESSGAAPYENLRYLTGLHRVPATAAFDQAADFVLQRAREYGFKNAVSEQFPIDGTTTYGLMRSHLGWQVTTASLWQVAPDRTLIGDWATDPVRLADYSHSGEVEAALVDVGAGSRDVDYAGKQVGGKFVLADGVLSEVQALAILKYGAAGIVSDMPNQSTAWSGLDPTLVRWGHLDARAPKGFAFMVSKATATALRAQLAEGTGVTLRAHVQAEVGPSHWTVVTASIPGTDPSAGEVVFSCHLDHQRPGANDNGSGCVTILESARILNNLIGRGALPRPARGLRFVWGPEVEGTMAYLSRHPEVRQALRADIHMDMVGGDPFKNKSMLHVTATPWSLPSFVTDVGEVFAETIREASIQYAEGGDHAREAIIEERGGAPGTRNEFLADETPYAEGSDHDDYDSSTIAVPSLYLRDWPDVYIHTDHDSLLTIDPTKLRRVAVLGAASGYSLAALGGTPMVDVLPFLTARAEQRLARGFEQAQALARASGGAAEAAYEAHNYMAQLLNKETAMLESAGSYTHAAGADVAKAQKALHQQSATLADWLPTAALAPAWRTSAEGRKVPHRIGEFGPLTYQNDDVLRARLGGKRMSKIKLLSGDRSHLFNVQENGALYAYEIVNFIDGKRNVADIRDAISAEIGPLPLDAVSDYLKACEEAKIIEFR